MEGLRNELAIKNTTTNTREHVKEPSYQTNSLN